MADEPNRSLNASQALVAIAGWLVPGSGYLLIGQYTRGIVVGATILAMFFFGLLVGGIRCLDVPGYNAHGHKLLLSYYKGDNDRQAHELISDFVPDKYRVEGWVLPRHPVDEIRTKPWNIPQFLVGPLDIVCDYWAISVSAINPATGYPIAARSHSRINELGILYTAVAGMLNLLAIIDSAYRAGARPASPETKSSTGAVPSPAKAEAV